MLVLSSLSRLVDNWNEHEHLAIICCMNVRWNSKTNRHLNHRWERFKWTHPCLLPFLNVIVNTAKELLKDGKIPIERVSVPLLIRSFRSMHGQIVLMQIVSRITFDIIWSLYEPFLRQNVHLIWKRSRTYPPLMTANEIYSWLPTTRTLANSNPALTRTKVDFPWISFIHLL